ncbi:MULTISPECIES: GAF domain-containing protein [Rhizobium]|uniref:GAF sensor protein n=1 Tax=Rhizobium favelukesii TaxID=348824 RepID=W6R915_9HYPH|nr:MULTISPECIES: GAF domain-containing protein [Rhizobium]MCA0801039.1 GAF domain-containing protein [Rhizobium sp. T1473]MCS0458597.1 GAF domain-containing protein [Rhizobium favelukesii]UFS81406.1 GAF domain-containing protein [Rhizobium sp. T136]CDM56895.1 putative GAF sensor protein [Rhizobium favelukesii]
MTLHLSDLRACFEGVIPSIIATSSGDGRPNISYLSHVIMIDSDHVALSNQFFAKTAHNIRANPYANLLLVDARNGGQFRLDIVFSHPLEDGVFFDRVATQLQASSEQVGMGGIMKLKGLDVFRVLSIASVPSPVVLQKEAVEEPSRKLIALSRLVDRIAIQNDVGGAIDVVLSGLESEFGYTNTLFMLHDEARRLLATVGSRGYERSGVGSEAAVGEGIIGAAAVKRRLVKVSDMSRVRRYGAAIRTSSVDEERTRAIVLPGMRGAMSQMAVPVMAQDVLLGVLFAESRQRLAFSEEDEAVMTVVARQAAATLALCERLASETQKVAKADKAPAHLQSSFRVVHHAYDDSVFIDNAYVIKGVAGRMLMMMLSLWLREGRTEFTNREIRLSDSLRLPEIKDNLETRLLLLRRRLEEKGTPVRLVRAGRGLIRLELDGVPRLDTVGLPV